MKQKMKVRWAFDPFTDHTETWQRAMEFLYQLQDSTGARVTPTYILGSEITDWVSYAVPNQGVDIYNGAREACLSKLKDLDTRKAFEEPEILRSSAYSKRSDAATLTEHMEGYDLIMINTHARKGLKRLIIGSFAENVLLKSKTPVVFVSPNTEEVKKINKVLFPTDLSVSSRVVFNAFLKKDFNLAEEIFLYSKVSHPSTAFLSNTSIMLGGGPVSIDQYLPDQVEAKMREGAEWVENAKATGFKSNMIVDDAFAPLPERILNFAKQKSCDMIAMPSFASRLDTVLVGSETREVIRQSPIPVLVWPIERDDGKVSLY